MIKKVMLTLVTTLHSFICVFALEPTLEATIYEYVSARARGSVKEILKLYDQESFKIIYPELFKQYPKEIAISKSKEFFEKDLLLEYKEQQGILPSIKVERVDSEGSIAYVDILTKWGLKLNSKEGGYEEEKFESLMFVKNSNKWEITYDLEKAYEILRESWNRDYDAMLKKLEISPKHNYTDNNIKDYAFDFLRKSIVYGYAGVLDFLPDALFIPNGNKFKKYYLKEWVERELLPLVERPTFIDQKSLGHAQISRQILSPGACNLTTFLSGETLKELSKRKIVLLTVTLYEPQPPKEISSEFNLGLWESIKDGLYIKMYFIQTNEGPKFIGYYTPKVE